MTASRRTARRGSRGRETKSDVLRELGRQVREFRKTRGLTQQELADVLDVSIAYVSLIERGGRNPPYTTVVAVARALGVSVGELLPR